MIDPQGRCGMTLTYDPKVHRSNARLTASHGGTHTCKLNPGHLSCPTHGEGPVLMHAYSKGGIVRGPDIMLRMVPEVSPDGNGSLTVIFADECFINSERLCTRRDQFHANAPHASIRADRWWRCPLHDGGVS